MTYMFSLGLSHLFQGTKSASPSTRLDSISWNFRENGFADYNILEKDINTPASVLIGEVSRRTLAWMGHSYVANGSKGKMRRALHKISDCDAATRLECLALGSDVVVQHSPEANVFHCLMACSLVQVMLRMRWVRISCC